MEIKIVKYDKERQFKLYENNEKISQLFWNDYSMRLGLANVKVSVPTFGYTSPAFRKKGYFKLLFLDGLKYLRANNYDVSLLRGIRGLYHKYGYAAVLPNNALHILVKEAEKAKNELGNYKIRKFRLHDNAKLLKIYDDNKDNFCSLKRNKEYFSDFQRDDLECFVVENSNNNIVAYAISSHNENCLNIIEFGAKIEAKLYNTLLVKFAKMALKQRIININILLPVDHPFAEFCCRKYRCKTESIFVNDGFVMMRIINQDSLLKKLEINFNKRISYFPLNNTVNSFQITTELGSNTFYINQGNLKIFNGNKKTKTTINLSQGHLIQLIMGYRSVNDMLFENNIVLDNKVKELLNILFPKGNAYLWERNRFEGFELKTQKDSSKYA